MIDLVAMMMLTASHFALGDADDNEDDPACYPVRTQSCEAPFGVARKIRNITFAVLVVIKCMYLMWSLFTMIKRYRTTHKTYCMPEVYFIAVTLIKVAILLPNYFLQEMNTFYFTFCMNSLCSYFLTYILS